MLVLSDYAFVVAEKSIICIAFEMERVDYIISFAGNRVLEALHDMKEPMSWNEEKNLRKAICLARLKLKQEYKL